MQLLMILGERRHDAPEKGLLARAALGSGKSVRTVQPTENRVQLKQW
jgi:hypothetical protein